MADRSETSVEVELNSGGSSWGVYTALVTTGDSVTFSDFSIIKNSVVVDLGDNSSVSHSTASNIMTVSGSGLKSEKVLLFIQGVGS